MVWNCLFGKRNTETSFSLNTSVGNQEVVRTIDVLNAYEYAAILNEASANAGEGIVLKSKHNVFLDKNKCINFADNNKMFILSL